MLNEEVIRVIVDRTMLEDQYDEWERERFLRLAPRRVVRVLDAIRILSRCANRSQYDYSEFDVKKIFTALELAVSQAREKFRPPIEVETEFSL